MVSQEECKRSGFAEFAILLVSGGAITGILQIISDAVGNTRLKEMYKKCQETILEQKRQIESLYERKENYKDTVYIVRAKVEMYHRQCEVDSPCCVLTEEILHTIDNLLPSKTLIPEIDNDK